MHCSVCDYRVDSAPTTTGFHKAFHSRIMIRYENLKGKTNPNRLILVKNGHHHFTKGVSHKLPNKQTNSRQVDTAGMSKHFLKNKTEISLWLCVNARGKNAELAHKKSWVQLYLSAWPIRNTQVQNHDYIVKRMLWIISLFTILWLDRKIKWVFSQ